MKKILSKVLLPNGSRCAFTRSVHHGELCGHIISIRSILLLILLIAVFGSASAQKSVVDSLEKAYRKNKQDTTLVQLLDEKAIHVYLQTNTDSGLWCTRQGLALSRRIHYRLGEERALANMATYMMGMGDLPSALRVTFEALPIAIQLNDKAGTAECYNTLGLTYNTLKDLKKAGEYYYKGLVMAEQNHQFALQIVELNNISRNYLDRNMPDSAQWYTNKAYALVLQKKMLSNMGFLIRNFGIIEFRKGNYVKAIAYYNKSAAQQGTLTNHYLQSEDARRTAEAYQKLNKLDSCIFFAKKAYGQSKFDRSPDNIMKATSLLSEVYRSQGDFKNAYQYQQLMLAAQDTLFSQQKTMQVQNLAFSEQQRQEEIKAAEVAYQNKVRFYGLAGVLIVFALIAFVLLYANQKRKKANELLHQQNEQIQNQHKELEKTLGELKNTQQQLVQSEKLASLGELTAGIAHEIQNPLNFVNNFAEVSVELVDELAEELTNKKRDAGLEEELITDLKQNLEKITHHGKRADGIVKNMLQHSRANSGEAQPTDINVLADEYLRLAYHGLRAKEKDFNSATVTNLDSALPKISVIPQDIGRVLLNLFNNAFYAVHQKKLIAGADYKPEVSVTTSAANGQVSIKVKDNGNGIPDAIKDKIMQPFFTTKPTGEGTGLGLSLSYDIVVKGHGGSISVDSNEGDFTEFTITLPI